MSRVKKVFSAVILASFVLGALTLLAPAPAAAPPVDDPNCKHPCPAVKMHNGYPCTFVGCDPVSGMCMYGC